MKSSRHLEKCGSILCIDPITSLIHTYPSIIKKSLLISHAILNDCICYLEFLTCCIPDSTNLSKFKTHHHSNEDHFLQVCFFSRGDDRVCQCAKSQNIPIPGEVIICGHINEIPSQIIYDLKVLKRLLHAFYVFWHIDTP